MFHPSRFSKGLILGVFFFSTIINSVSGAFAEQPTQKLFFNKTFNQIFANPQTNKELKLISDDFIDYTKDDGSFDYRARIKKYSFTLPEFTKETGIQFVEIFSKEAETAASLKGSFVDFPIISQTPDQLTGSKSVQFTITKNGTIKDPQELTKNLVDKTQAREWLRKYIRESNKRAWLETMKAMPTYTDGGGWNLTTIQNKKNVAKIMPQILNLAEVLVRGIEFTETTSSEISVKLTLYPLTHVVTENGYALFENPNYKFTIQYPKKWYYSSKTTTDKNSIRHYEFGPKPLDKEEGTVSLDLFPGKIPVGTVVKIGTKEVVVVEKQGRVQIYCPSKFKRWYRLVGPLKEKENLLKMASTLED